MTLRSKYLPGVLWFIGRHTDEMDPDPFDPLLPDLFVPLAWETVPLYSVLFTLWHSGNFEIRCLEGDISHCCPVA